MKVNRCTETFLNEQNFYNGILIRWYKFCTSVVEKNNNGVRVHRLIMYLPSVTSLDFTCLNFTKSCELQELMGVKTESLTLHQTGTFIKVT